MEIVRLVVQGYDSRENLVVVFHPERLQLRTWPKSSLISEDTQEMIFVLWHPVLIVAINIIGKIHKTFEFFAGTQ